MRRLQRFKVTRTELVPHQVSHVCRGVVIQSQSKADSIEDLIRRIVFSALLKPQVVVGADTSDYSDLLPAQPSDSAAPACR
jgi:hypothetical protein